jgi:hypothetical protein
MTMLAIIRQIKNACAQKMRLTTAAVWSWTNGIQDCMLLGVAKKSLRIGPPFLLVALFSGLANSSMPAPPTEHCLRVKILRGEVTGNPFDSRAAACAIDYQKLEKRKRSSPHWSSPIKGWMWSSCPSRGDIFFADIMLWDQGPSDAPLPSRVTRLDEQACVQEHKSNQ